MNVFRNYIIFFTWAAWLLFNFGLKQKQNFYSEALLKMPPLSPSMEEFCLDIQKINNFKISKDLTFQK